MTFPLFPADGRAPSRSRSGGNNSGTADTVAIQHPQSPRFQPHPLRIGFENNPPVQIRTATGFSGLSVEIVNEAARRAGIQLDWVETGTSSEEAFRKGLVDLWPLMVDLPDRRKYVHFAPPVYAQQPCAGASRPNTRHPARFPGPDRSLQVAAARSTGARRISPKLRWSRYRTPRAF